MVTGRQYFFNNRIIAGLIIFVFAFLVFAPSLKNDFIWDDVIEIKKQYFKYQDYSISSLFIPGVRTTQGTSYFRPIVHMSYVFDYSIWADNPLGFHLTNIFLFSICCLLIYFLVLLILGEYKVEGKEFIASLSAIYFAVHPMHVESVSWIAGRTDVLCGLFFTAAFIFHVKSRSDIRYLALSVPFFVLSLLSKEVGVAFPFVVLGYDLITDRRLSKGLVSRSGVYMVFLLLYIYMRMRGGSPLPIPETEATPSGGSPQPSPGFIAGYLSDIKIMLSAYLYYFGKMVFPFRFNAFITSVPSGISYLLLSLIAFAGLLFLFLRSFIRWKGIVAFSLFWIVLTLGPSVLVAVFSVATTPLAERYLFIPTAGLALMSGYLLALLLRRAGGGTGVYMIVGLFIFAHLFATVDRQSVWRDRVTFWNKTSARDKSQINAVPLINHGMALIDQGKLDEGIRKLEESFAPGMQASPYMRSVAANNIGIAYLSKGQIGPAEKWFEKGVEFNPQFKKSYFHLGLVHYSRGKESNSAEELRIAEGYFKKAIEIDGSYARAYFLLAKVNIENGDIASARKNAEQALELGLERPLDQQAKDIINIR